MKPSLSTKIFVGFAVSLGTFTLLAFLSVREIRAIADDLRTIRDGHIALARNVAQLETVQQNRIRDLKLAMSATDPKSRELLLNIATAYHPELIRSTIEEARNVCTSQIANARPIHTTDSEMRIASYRNIQSRIDRIADQHDTLDELTRTAMRRHKAQEPLGEDAAKVDAIEVQLRSETHQLNKYINDETDRAVRRAEQDERNTILRVLVMTGIALIVGLVLTILSARSLSPISRLVRYARAISRGDYEQAVDLRGEDELSVLAEELQRMARARKEREAELDLQAAELEAAYKRVAELKRYHESVVRSLHTAIVVTDRELLVTSVNRAAESHWGLPADVRGKKLDELAIGPVLVKELGPLSELVLHGKTVDANALSIGDKRADVTIAPFENQRGDVLGLVLAIEDVTDAVLTKEALIRSERLAAIGRMSAHVTHEIRNPLSSIGLNAELLQDLAKDDEATALCSAIVREVDRLTAITDDYLRFARLPRPILEDAELAPMLSAIAVFQRRDLEAAKVKLVLDFEPDLPPVRLDGDQMRQAILNLVRNAKESMPQGGTIVLGARREASNAVMIFVKDSGVGIPQESLDRIFDPFFSTKLTGTGLGLALTQQIVTEHGALLRVDSTVGVGSEFGIVIPTGPELARPMVFTGVDAGAERASPGRFEEVETTGAKGRAAG